MYINMQAVRWAFSAQIKPSSLKFTLIALAGCADASGRAFPSTEHLCALTGSDRKTVVANLDRLESLKYIADSGLRAGRTQQVKIFQLLGFLDGETSPKTAPLNNPEIGIVIHSELAPLSTISIPNSEHLKQSENGMLSHPMVPDSGYLKPPENGTIPETEGSRFSSESLPFLDGKAPVFPSKASRKRDTELNINNKTNKKAPEPSIVQPIEIPDWLPEETWQSYLNYRRSAKGKQPFTVHAQKLAIRELGKLRDAGNDPRDVIERSILNGWAGLFPLHGNKTAPGVKPKTSNDDFMRGLI